MQHNEIEKNLVAENKIILDEFRMALNTKQLSEKTIKSNIDNIDFFAEYLKYYEPLEGLSTSSAYDVNDFLGEWFPRKAMWASPSNVRSYISSFKKFFNWMVNEQKLPLEEYADLLSLIKEEKEAWLAASSYEEGCYF